jgi:hypothetical protein
MAELTSCIYVINEMKISNYRYSSAPENVMPEIDCGPCTSVVPDADCSFYTLYLY